MFARPFVVLTQQVKQRHRRPPRQLIAELAIDGGGVDQVLECFVQLVLPEGFSRRLVRHLQLVGGFGQLHHLDQCGDVFDQLE